MVEKLKTFERGDPVVVHGAEGVVHRTDETALTIYVQTGKLCPGYSVTVVEHHPNGTKAKTKT